ncbi:MAG: RNA 2',3'-cyclic phosphodiesterase [Chloroflexota bacterium]
MSEGIRAFVGFSLPAEVKDTLEDIQFDLMDMVPENAINWNRSANLHMTLAFLGDNNRPEQIGQVCDALDMLAAAHNKITLRIGPLGCFPRKRNPKVIYAGVQGQTKQLFLLKENLDSVLEPIGYEPEQRKYTPHLTLGYVRKPDQVVKAQFPFGSHLPEVKWTNRTLHLYHSYKSKKGPVYKKIHSARLESETS